MTGTVGKILGTKRGLSGEESQDGMEKLLQLTCPFEARFATWRRAIGWRRPPGPVGAAGRAGSVAGVDALTCAR